MQVSTSKEMLRLKRMNPKVEPQIISVRLDFPSVLSNRKSGRQDFLNCVQVFLFFESLRFVYTLVQALVSRFALKFVQIFIFYQIANLVVQIFVSVLRFSFSSYLCMRKEPRTLQQVGSCALQGGWFEERWKIF